MKSKKQVFLVFIGVLVIGMSFGMSSLIRPAPNTRWFIKGNVKVWGTIDANDQASYYAMEIGDQNVPWFKNPPPLRFMLDKKLVSARDLNGSNLVNLQKSSVRTTEDKRWPVGTKVCSLEAYSFWIYSDRIYRLKIEMYLDPVTGKEVRPSLAGFKYDRVFKFPLSEQDVGELLGDPDEIINFFRK